MSASDHQHPAATTTQRPIGHMSTGRRRLSFAQTGIKLRLAVATVVSMLIWVVIFLLVR